MSLMKLKLWRVTVTATAMVLALGAMNALAQTNDSAGAVATGTDAGGLGGWLAGVAQGYPWLTTVLFVIGGLRVVFKPVMALVDAYVKGSCSAAEYAKLQQFEAGSAFHWVSFGLDLVGSVKLPVVSAAAQVRAGTEGT